MLTFPITPSVGGSLWVIAVALTVLFLDVFFSTEILSIAALLGVSSYGALLSNVPWKWTILVALVCWVISVALFYTLWKRVVAPLILHLFDTGPKETIYSAKGKTGEFREIEGKFFVLWNGRPEKGVWPSFVIFRRRF